MSKVIGKEYPSVNEPAKDNAPKSKDTKPAKDNAPKSTDTAK